MQLGLDWLYGRSLGGNFALRLDPVHPQYPQKIEAPPPPVTVRTDAQRQAALAELLAQRDPRQMQASRLRESRAADRNGFIDGLWRLGSDYADIQIRQGTLDLAVAGTVSASRCAATSRLMQGVATHLARIRLHDTDDKHSVSCAVPRSLEAAPVSAVFLTDSDMPVLTQAALQVETIDASAGPERPNSQATIQAIRAALAAQNLFVVTVALSESEVTVYYTNYHYQAEGDCAVDRMVRSPQQRRRRPISRALPAYRGQLRRPRCQEFDILRGPAERSDQQGRPFPGPRPHHPRLPAMDQPALAAAVSGESSIRASTGAFIRSYDRSYLIPTSPLGIQLVTALERRTGSGARGLEA